MSGAARGCLLAFEGVDGCGKTTQAERVRAWVGARWPDWTSHLLREPGATPVGEAIRELLLARGSAMRPLTEVMLYMASRAELYETRVRPALAAGDLVLLDRSYYSTVAYQGAGLGIGRARILELAAIATEGCAIDRVVVFALPPAVAAARRARAPDRIEQRGADYFESVAAAYRALAEAEPERILLVDAERDADAVAADVRARLEPWLAERRA